MMRNTYKGFLSGRHFMKPQTLNHLHVRRWLLMDSAPEYILHVYLFLTDGARFEDSQGFKCGFFFGCLTVALWT